MENLGKKKKKNIVAGAGLLLSLLRGEQMKNMGDSDNDNDQEAKIPNQPQMLDDQADAGMALDYGNREISPQKFCDYKFTNTSKPMLSACETSTFSRLNNFLKGCKWSPDGAHLLTNSEDKVLRIFQQPGLDNLYNLEPGLMLVSSFMPGDLIYDYCWHPSVMKPSVVAVCSHRHPIHLWDFAGKASADTYTPKNHLDELADTYSLAISIDGCKLYGGHKNKISVFDVQRPGTQLCTKNTRVEMYLGSGQSGIVSCIAMCPTNSTIFACGSYNKTVAIYTDELEGPQFVLHGQTGGVTHVMYSPDGNCLFSGGRKDNEIYCWDMRNLGSALAVFQRTVGTNQRIYFDIDKKGCYLATGNDDGYVKIWSLKTPSECCKFKAHEDCTNGVSFHPFVPLFATSSGQRRFSCRIEEEDDSDLSQDEKENDHFENTLKIWKTDEDIHSIYCIVNE